MSHLHSHVQFSDNILTQEFPFLSFLPGHPDMTYYLLIFIFFGISRGPCNNWHYLGHVKHDDNDDDDKMWWSQWEFVVGVGQFWSWVTDETRHPVGIERVEEMECDRRLSIVGSYCEFADSVILQYWWHETWNSDSILPVSDVVCI